MFPFTMSTLLVLLVNQFIDLIISLAANRRCKLQECRALVLQMIALYKLWVKIG
jgi:hypothetical protein